MKLQKMNQGKSLFSFSRKKFDLIEQEKISEEEGKELAEKWSAYFSLLSAKFDKEGIDNFFYNIVNEFLKDKKEASIIGLIQQK